VNRGVINNPTVTVTGDLSVATNATFSAAGSNPITINGGDVTGDGTINLTGGTFLLDAAGNFGGATAWTFSSLTFGDGTGATTTTATGAGGITVTSVLTIAANQTLSAGSKTYTLSGTGTPFVRTGTFTSVTSTVLFSGTGSQTIAGSTTFYNLQVTTTTARTVSFTAGTTQSVATGGSVTFTGAEGQLLTLASTSAGTEWNLQVDLSAASQSIQYVSVSDSNAGPTGTYMQMLATDGTSNEGDNNTNWDFGRNASMFLTFF
jgi:hypothetical protein